MRRCLTMSEDVATTAPKALEAWQFVQQMLADVTKTVLADARDEREVLDGLRVVSRVTALCSELSIEADPELPWFFDMCSPTRMVGGPNPDGRYLLAMIRGDRRYRITGTRGTTAYLGLQVLAGTGMTPRRMAAYLSDTDLKLDAGSFAVVVSADEPAPAELDGAQWLHIPADAASIVVREYVGDAADELPATLHIETLDAGPPDTRYWNVTLENIWHECIEPRRRHSSVTNKGVAPDADGKIRIAIGTMD